jgi:hypothetical protein
MLKLTTQYEFHELFLNSPSIHQYCIFTCDKSTNVHRMAIVNYFTYNKYTNMHRMVIVNYYTCDKSTNVYRMVTVNYFTCDKSTNVYRMVAVNYFTCDKSTNVYRMVTANYLTCHKSTNVYRMVAVNYLTCDKSTNVYRMVIVNYFTCDKSVQWVKKSLSQISNSELCARKFLKCRIRSMSSVLFTCPGDGGLPHPQVGAGIAIKTFLISLYSKVKSKSVETTAT